MKLHFYRRFRSRLLFQVAAWLLFLLPALPGLAQRKSVEYQRLVWFRYNNNLLLSEKWRLNSEFDERRYAFPDRQHQFLVRTNLQHKFSQEWEGGGGFTYFLQSPHDPESDSELVIPELRPHQELNFRKVLGERWTMRQRYKLEERFFRNTADGKLTNSYHFNFRMRFKLDLEYTFLRNQEGKEKATIIVSDEILLNAGQEIVHNVFDQNRIYAAVRFNTGAKTAVEAGYLLWFQQRASGKDFYHRDILRFSFFHKLDLSKKKPE